MKELLRKSLAFVKANPRADLLFLAIGLTIFSTVAIFNATNASIWFDEAFSAYLVQFSFADIAHFTSLDVHPPFYYWVLKAWSMLFGTGELALRALSVLFGAAAIALTYGLARRQFGRLAASVTLLFLIVSPMLIRYSDEARMYTLVAVIVLLAMHVLLRASATNSRALWVLYGILVALGMWTHYFSALIWITHWLWRGAMIKKVTTKAKAFWKKFFSKDWIIAHVVAAGLFAPWLPFMAIQLGSIQGTGFWIGPVGVDSLNNYFSNLFYYLEHSQVYGWLAMAIFVVVGGLTVLAVRTFKTIGKSQRASYLLVTLLALAPVALLFAASLPPLKSSFVERYLLVSVIAFAVFAAVSIVVGTRRWRPILRVLPVILVLGMMIYGVTNVYAYGNYNKNSQTHILTRELVEKVKEKSSAGEPIIAASPWVFYEAIYYTSDENPVLFIDEQVEYIYGSLAMLKERDQHKIKDVSSLASDYETVWYIGFSGTEIEAPYDNWKKIQTVDVTSPVDGKTVYRGTQFSIE